MEIIKYFALYLVVYFAWASIIALIPIYMNETIGLSLKSIGFLMSSIPLITLLFQPLWGIVSDLVGNSKRMLQYLFLGTLILSLFMTYFKWPYVAILVYAFYTIFLCGQGPIKDSMTIAYTQESDKYSFGTIRVWGSIGYAFGAYGAAYIANIWGMNWIFYLGALGYASAIFLVSTFKSKRVPQKKGSYFKDLKTLMKNRTYLLLLVFSFFIVGTTFGSDQYLGLFVRHVGFDLRVVGQLMFIAVCIEIPFVFYSKRLLNFFGVFNLLLVLNLLGVIRMVVLGSSGYFISFLIAGVLRGISVGIFIPIFLEVIAKATDQSILTSAIAIYTAISTGIAVFVFTFVGGFVVENFGYYALYFGFGMVQLLPLTILIFKRRTMA